MAAIDESAPPLIPQFYAGRSVLITGATGFLGKMLCERLLSTCPDIGRVFLLMRGKRSSSAEQRFQDLKDSLIFNLVRERDPSSVDKLQLLSGDIVEPNFGLTESNIEGLKDVSIVFHCAASVKFNDPLELSMAQNLRAVLTVVEICDTLPNIQALMYVSTAYCNSERSVIEERVYPPPKRLEDALAVTGALPAELLARITDEYISPKPNTYTFAKALAEAALQDHGCSKYPIAIFRPTIVVSALKHPYPGWVESLSGMCGLAAGAGRGLLQGFEGDSTARADLLPVDLAVDTLIAAAWETVLDRPEEVRVYNCSTGENPITFGETVLTIRTLLRTHPHDGALWYPSWFMVKNEFLAKCCRFLLNTVPLYAADFVCRVFGIKTRIKLVKLSQSLSRMITVLAYFTRREWVFVRDNTRKLQRRLSPQDAAIFNLDPMSICWKTHLKYFVIGIRKYQFKQKDEDLPKAKRRMRILCVIHYTALSLVTVLLLWLLMTFMQGAFRIVNMLYDGAFNMLID